MSDTDHFDYRSFIRNHKPDFCGLENPDPDHFLLVTDYAEAQINFYQIEGEPEIIEFRIDNLKNHETEFFLHFHAEPEEHARDLYRQMVQTLKDLGNRKNNRILLCCTAGMTTSFFAEELNKTAQTLHENYEFEAVSVNEVYVRGLEFDAVLVAPQVGFMQKKIAAVLKDMPVIAVPASIFGSYNTGACLELVKDTLKKFRETMAEQAEEKILRSKTNDKVILGIAILPDARKTWVRFRVYDHGKTTETSVVTKPKFSLADICDIIETYRCSCSGKMKIDAIGIAVPGIIHNGMIDLRPSETIDLTKGQDNFDISSYFNEKYDVPVYIFNNVNAAAYGYYGSQDSYQNIVFHSQPIGWKMGGEGIIVNGKLLTGHHAGAGEVKYIIPMLKDLEDIPRRVQTPEQMVKVIAADLIGACTYLDPQVICIRSHMTPDIDAIREEMEKHLPADHIPDFVYIDVMDEYVLLGTMILCLQEEARNKKA